MNLNKDTRMWLGLLLIVVALFYKGGGPLPTPTPDKLVKPEAEIVALVESLADVSDPADANKLAATFNAMSEKLSVTNLTSNLQVQYFLDFVGKNTVGGELMVNGQSKYPEFAPSAAALIAQVIGPQTEETPLTSEEKNKLARLFYGFSWKLYDDSQDEVYESYKSKALAAIAEYNREDDGPSPDDDDDCPCEGKGYIIHGDGHRTPCPCVEGGGTCNCKGAMGSESGCNCGGDCNCGDGECKCQKQAATQPAEPPVTVQEPPSNNPFGFTIPNYANYSPRVGVRGMTVRYHLVTGAPGEHNPVPASFVDTLTINQQYWLHDYLHGYATAPSSTRTTTVFESSTYNSNNCANGRCATPTRTYQRRGILGRWLRR